MIECIPSSRSMAIDMGETHYLTGKPCKRGHVAMRFTCNADCVECVKLRKADHIAENMESVRENNRRYGKKRYLENPEKLRSYLKQWRTDNIDRIHEREKELRSTPQRRLEHSISSVVRRCITSEIKAGRGTFSLLGYTVDELRSHLEKRFTEGMTWDNYGKWHVDHIIPRSVFNYQTPEDIDFKRCWSLSNLQPLWAKDNTSKGAKIFKPFQPSLALGIIQEKAA